MFGNTARRRPLGQGVPGSDEIMGGFVLFVFIAVVFLVVGFDGGSKGDHDSRPDCEVLQAITEGQPLTHRLSSSTRLGSSLATPLASVPDGHGWRRSLEKLLATKGLAAGRQHPRHLVTQPQAGGPHQLHYEVLVALAAIVRLRRIIILLLFFKLFLFF